MNYKTIDELDELFSEDDYFFLGHGIRNDELNEDEIVNSIFANGLRTKDNSLAKTTIGLDTPSNKMKELYRAIGIPEPSLDELKGRLDTWPHGNAKKIIIARVPTKYINKLGDQGDLGGTYYGAFFKEKEDSTGKSINYLNPKFILGCYDVDKKSILMNPGFEKDLTEESISELNTRYKELLERTKQKIVALPGEEIPEKKHGL